MRMCVYEVNEMIKGIIGNRLKRIGSVCAMLLGSVGFVWSVVEIGLYFVYERAIAILVCGLIVMLVSAIVGRNFERKGLLPMLIVWGGFSLIAMLAFLPRYDLSLLVTIAYLGAIIGETLTLLTVTWLLKWRTVKSLLPWHLQLMITLSLVIAECCYGINC